VAVTRRECVFAVLAFVFSRDRRTRVRPTSAGDVADRAFSTLAGFYLSTRDASARARQSVDLVADLAGRPDSMPGQMLAQRRHEDFRAGRVVILDGWIVAESEALLCTGLTLLARHA